MLTVAKNQVLGKLFSKKAPRQRMDDPRIAGVVQALNETEIRTTRCCEGHLTHGFPYPWVRIVADDRFQLERLLMAFYEQHPMTYDRLLMIEHLLDDEYMLRPHGGVLQEARDCDSQVACLKMYQQEMQAFEAFLKEGVFNGDIHHTASC